MTTRVAALFGALSLVTLAACGGGDLVLPGGGTAAQIEITSGGSQSGRVGTTLEQPVVALVSDGDGRPVANVRVAFEFVQGGEGATLSPDTIETDADGVARTTVTVGTRVGAAAGRARVLTADTGQTIAAPFTVSALSENANGIGAVSGDNQSGPVGTALAAPLVVQVTDAFGNPISGVTVTWTASGGGEVSPTVVTTDANGLASTQRMLGSATGVQTTQASAEGLAGSPVTFTSTAVAGSAARVVIVSGNGQSAAAGARLPQPLVVRVLDADGNGVPNRAISWIVAQGGGSFDPATSTTDANGEARSTWTLGPNPAEPNTASAVVSGIGIANFSANATGTGPGTSLAIRTQPSGSATTGVEFSRQPVVQLRDAAGNDVKQAGVAVTAAIASGPGSLGGTTTRSTDADGRANFTNLQISGASGSHTLLFAANGFTSVTSTPVDIRKASTTTRIVSDLPDPSLVGAAVAVRVEVTSASGSPSGAITVSSSSGGSCSASIVDGGCAIVLNTAGNQTLTATYAGNQQFDGSSDTESHRVNPPNAAPTARDDTASVREGGQNSVRIDVAANDTDPDGDNLDAVEVSDPPNGTATANSDGTVSYSPDSDWFGTDNFTYRASDGSATSNLATVTVTVLPVNDYPRFRIPTELSGPAFSGTISVPEFATGITPGNVLEADQQLTFVVAPRPEDARLFVVGPAISPSGTLTYTPNGSQGEAVITVILRDDGGTANGGKDTSPPQTFTLTLNR